MKNITPKKLTVLYTAVFILLILYILSFTVFSSSASQKRIRQQIQLLHEADISSIDQIAIQNNSSYILLTRKNNMWLASANFEYENFLPADTEVLQKFFVSLISQHNMIKAGKKEIENMTGINQQNAVTISLVKNGELYQNLYFGELNFSQSERYFTTDELNSIFLIDTSFDSYLTTSSQYWCDPYLISEQLKNSVFQMGDIQSLTLTYNEEDKPRNIKRTPSWENWNAASQKLLELRHGGFAPLEEISVIDELSLIPVMSLEFEMGDKSVINQNFYLSQSVENEYLVKTTFSSPRSSEDFTCYSKISLWTYNKIKEMIL